MARRQNSRSGGTVRDAQSYCHMAIHLIHQATRAGVPLYPIRGSDPAPDWGGWQTIGYLGVLRSADLISIDRASFFPGFRFMGTDLKPE